MTRKGLIRHKTKQISHFLSIQLSRCTTWTLTKSLEKKLKWEQLKNAMS